MKLLSPKPRAVRFAFTFALFCVAAFAYFQYSKRNTNVVTVLFSTPQLQSVNIGSYNDLETGQRAAIQQLSRQLKAHPKTRDFSINWSIAASDKSCQMEYANGSLLKCHVYTVFVGSWQLVPHPPFITRMQVWDDGETSLIWWPQVSVEEIHNAARENKTYDEIYKNKMPYSHQ